MNYAKLIDKTARHLGDRPAVSKGERVVWTYRALADRVGRLGARFQEMGLAPGDRVAQFQKNGPETFEVLLALWQAGLAAVPVNAKLHPKELAYILDHSGAKLCFATADLADAALSAAKDTGGACRVIVTDSAEYRALPAARRIDPLDVAPDAIAWLFYTSGTTGRPKGAMLSHRNLLMMTLSYLADIDPIAPTDSWISGAALSHGAGCYALPHLAKGANNVVPESGAFDPAEFASLIGRWPGASMFFAPTMVTRLIDSPAIKGAELGNLKTLVYGGGPMYLADCRRALEVLGPRLQQIYGQGESPMTITGLSKAMHADTTHPRHLERLASTGVARTDVEVRVTDDRDRDLPLGEVGEVLVRGDVVMKGYWRNPEASAASLKDGWLHTGDMGAFDADGFLTLKDRSKDMIISGGSNIYPREVEEVLLRHPGVLEVSVVGKPHADWGEETIAFVVTRPGARLGEGELDKLCLDAIARFKRPKGYRFVAELPKNNYGKILKTELRKVLEQENPRS
ncbi:MAG: long-chain fatty acid--CoA ligase [Alphaproteobacteria bacterium]|nr:long-chain fatty acid--CoA ligase [Alphaproteobacteria bacterium]